MNAEQLAALTPESAWSKVQGDSDPLNWMLLSFDSKNLPASIKVFAAGTGGMDELKGSLDDEQVLFGGFRVTGVDDRGSVKSVRSKLVFVQWVGSGVARTVRAHSGTARGEFQRIINGTHLSLNIEQASGLQSKDIEETLIKNGGAHKCGYYLFGSKITKPEQIPARGGAAPEAAAKAPEPESPKQPESPKELTPEAAWSKVQGDSDPLNWMLLNYDGKDPKTAKVFGSGTGGMDELKAALDDTQVLFGGFRVTGVDDRGSVKSLRSKLIFIQFTGNVKPTVRAQAGTARGEFQRIINGTHLSLNIEQASGLSAKAVEETLIKNGGAHKCGYYLFGPKITKPEQIPARDGDGAPIDHGAAMPPQQPAAKPQPEPSPAAKPAEQPAEKKPAEPEKKPVEEKPAAAAAAATPPAPAAPVNAGELTPESAWSKVQGDSDPLNWMLLSYDSKNFPASIKVFAAGSGGMDEFKAAFDDETVLFGGLRVCGVDDRGSVKSVRSKLIFVQHTPSGVKPTVRAHAGTARGEFQRVINGTHLSLNIDRPDQLSAKTIEETLIKNGGAHKCGYYCFGPKITKPEQIPAGSGPQ